MLALVSAPNFGTGVQVETNQCDGILPVVSPLLQTLSRRSLRSQFLKTSRGMNRFSVPRPRFVEDKSYSS